MRRVALGVALVALVGFDWGFDRGSETGTLVASGSGKITDQVRGYPIVTRRSAEGASLDGYDDGETLLGDFGGETDLDVLYVRGDRVYRRGVGAGFTTAVSDPLAQPRLVGVYDFDADGRALELVVAGTGVGGRLYVLDSTSLSVKWMSSPLSCSGGGACGAAVAVDEVRIGDINGDNVNDIVWGSNFVGLANLQLVTFKSGFLAPGVLNLDLGTTASKGLQIAFGNFSGPAASPTPGFTVWGENKVTTVKSVPSTTPGAECSEANRLCVQRASADLWTAGAAPGGFARAMDADRSASDPGVSEWMFAGTDAALTPSFGMYDPVAAAPTTTLSWFFRYPATGTTAARIDAPDGLLALPAKGGFPLTPLVGVSVFNSQAQEFRGSTGPDNLDCLSATAGANKWGSVWMDAATGRPLAAAPNSRLIAAAGLNDNSADAWAWQLTSTGTVSGLMVARLSYISGTYPGSGTGSSASTCVSAVSSTAPTGAQLASASALDLSAAAVAVSAADALDVRKSSPDAWFSSGVNAVAPVGDLTGDDRFEIVVRAGTSLREYGYSLRVGSLDTVATVAGSCEPTLDGGCDTLSAVWGSGANTRFLVTGSGNSSCMRVVDNKLCAVSGGSFNVDSSGVAEVLLAGRADRPVWTVGKRLLDARSATPRQTLDTLPVLFADLDGDAVDELVTLDPKVTTGNANYRVQVWRVNSVSGLYEKWWGANGAGAGGLGDTTLFGSDPAQYPRHFTAGDFDGDGDADLAFYAEAPTPTTTSPGRLYLLNGRGNGSTSFTSLVNYAAPAASVASNFLQGGALLAADVWHTANNTLGRDSKVDVLLPTVTGLTIGDAAAARRGWTFGTGKASEVMLADFDGDGSLEAGIFDSLPELSHMKVAVAELDAAGTLNWTQPLPSPSGSWTSAGAVDVNADGKADFVFTDGEGNLRVLSGASGAAIGAAVSAGGGRPIGALALANIDGGASEGDAATEAIVGGKDGQVRVFSLSSGGATLDWSIDVGAPVSQVRVFDADDDGSLEVVVVTTDGAYQVIDGVPAEVEAIDPDNGMCISNIDFPDGVTVEGLSVAVDEVDVYLVGALGDEAVASGVEVIDDEWLTDPIDTLVEGPVTFRVEGFRDGRKVAEDLIEFNYRIDDDGDGYSECEDDCDDAGAAIHPGATETDADGIDSDCDSSERCFIDGDRDGARHATAREYFEGSAGGTDYCAKAAGGAKASATIDCNDAEATVYPGATEVIDDGVDQDCDAADTCYIDADDDGFRLLTARVSIGPAKDLDCNDAFEGKAADPSGDCDDTKNWIYPGAEETPGDEVDANCDGAETCFVDGDGDGFLETSGATVASDDLDCTDPGEGAATLLSGDCNDESADIYPGAVEVVADGVDQDCEDGDVCWHDVDGDGYLADVDPSDAEAERLVIVSEDLDCDDAYEAGNSDPAGDCRDGIAEIHPDAADVENGRDDDCDGFIDEGAPEADDDGDGYAETQGDCDDANAEVAPLGTEVANGVDDDCDGGIDEGSDASDNDGDGLSAVDGDCNDEDAAVRPGREDGCTGRDVEAIDDDCDGEVDEDCVKTEVETSSTCNSTGSVPGGVWGPALFAVAALARRRTRRAGLGGAAAIVALAGCHSGGPTVIQGGGYLVPEQPWLDFGVVPVGVATTAQLSVFNFGQKAFTIDGIASSDAEITYDETRVGTTVARSGDVGLDFVNIDVTWTPSAVAQLSPVEGEISTLTLTLRDASTSEAVFPIYGNAVDANARFVPTLLDFGKIIEPARRTVRLWNAGVTAVHVASVAVPEGPWSVDDVPEVGAALEPGDRVEITVHATATDVASGSLDITLEEGADGGQVVSLPLRANDCADPQSVIDDDGDGFTACGGDCDDGDEAVYPGEGECP